MSTFSDLFAAGAGRSFPEAVERSPFQLWAPGDSIPEQAVRLLIGVATSSASDMRLLDVLAEAMSRFPSALPAVDVFDAAECRRPEDLRRYIPTLRALADTPAAGIWFGGQLTWFGQGRTARDQIARMFGVAPERFADVGPPPTPVRP